jgi:hypothetical protein
MTVRSDTPRHDLLIRRYLYRVQRRPDRSAAWHDHKPPVRNRYSDWGACGKTRVVLQNRRPDQERTKTWGHDVRVLLSTYGGRGDEPLVGLTVRLRALGAEVRVCAPPDWAERPADSSEGRQREMRTCPTRGSTELEAPVIRSAVQRSTAASEVSR